MNKVWVYQADRILTDVETAGISSDLATFINAWTAHGSALASKAMVKDNLFLLFEVDESQAGVTGCSIDKSVHFLKSLGQRFAVDFFDRTKISFRTNEGEVRLVDRAEFEGLLKSGVVNKNTIVFNNLVQNSEELASKWEVPFSDSWHSKVF